MKNAYSRTVEIIITEISYEGALDDLVDNNVALQCQLFFFRNAFLRLIMASSSLKNLVILFAEKCMGVTVNEWRSVTEMISITSQTD